MYEKRRYQSHDNDIFKSNFNDGETSLDPVFENNKTKCQIFR